MRTPVAIVGFCLTGCATQPAAEPTAPPPPAASAPAPVNAPAVSEPTPTAASHVCAGRAQPEPCKNDVMRAGGFKDTPPCLSILSPMATGSAKPEAFDLALRDRAEAVWQCVAGAGADLSQSGKVMTLRVLVEPGKPARASFISSDLTPQAKSCVEGVAASTKWPSASDGTSEVTLRMVIVTRVWVDDPNGACPPR